MRTSFFAWTSEGLSLALQVDMAKKKYLHGNQLPICWKHAKDHKQPLSGLWKPMLPCIQDLDIDVVELLPIGILNALDPWLTIQDW